MQASKSSFKEIMNRLELAKVIADSHGVSQAEGARILATVTSAIVATVKKGEPVQIVGFGTFKQTQRAARTGRNPRDGSAVKIAAAKLPRFVAGAGFKDAVDPRGAKRRAEKADAKGASSAKAAKPAAKKAAKR